MTFLEDKDLLLQVLARMMMKLKKREVNGSIRTRYNVNFIEDKDLLLHVLPRMMMKLKKREVKRRTRTQYNVKFLEDKDLREEGNIDTQWQQIKEMWTSKCSEVLGKKKKKNWISADTINESAIEEGKERCR